MTAPSLAEKPRGPPPCPGGDPGCPGDPGLWRLAFEFTRLPQGGSLAARNRPRTYRQTVRTSMRTADWRVGFPSVRVLRLLAEKAVLEGRTSFVSRSSTSTDKVPSCTNGDQGNDQQSRPKRCGPSELRAEPITATRHLFDRGIRQIVELPKGSWGPLPSIFDEVASNPKRGCPLPVGFDGNGDASSRGGVGLNFRRRCSARRVRDQAL